MENSGKILFGEARPEWYVALGDQGLGPLTSEELYEKILTHQITWAHYAWRSGQAQWSRIYDLEEFQSSLPSPPSARLQREIKQSLEKSSLKPEVVKSNRKQSGSLSSEGRHWYLYTNHSQFGPFSDREIERMLKTGKMTARVYVWKDGMKNWERLGSTEFFKTQLSPSLPPSEEIQLERREEPRRPLVAKILMADAESVIVGVCRDISTGGLQVLSERIPANVGAKLKMNVSPSGEAGQKLGAFTTEGVVVRILEDGRGFSFRFEKLSEKSRQAIEAYVNAQ